MPTIQLSRTVCSMGCGSSRSLRVVTPIHTNGKAIVMPAAWSATHGHFKKPLLLRERPFPLGTHTGVQTDHEPLAVDAPVQTDPGFWSIPCERSEVGTQTPVDDGSDELERILAKAYRQDYTNAIASEHSSSVGVQTQYSRNDSFAQTESPGLSLLELQTSRVETVGQQERKNCRNVGAAMKYSLDVDPVSVMTSMESQTDPVAKAIAANSADSEAAGVLCVNELLSPFAHLQKELGESALAKDSNTPSNRENLHDSIAKLLLDVEDTLNRSSTRSTCTLREVGVQTDNDPITDEAPEYAARPPPCKKLEMIPDKSIFDDIDKRATEVPETATSSLRNLVSYLTESAKNELFKVRAFFRWIAHNITYDWKYMDVKLTAEEMLRTREGVCKDYCKLFGEMCRISNIRVKRVHGFAKGYDYRPGHQFHPGEDITHAWNAVFIFGAWRLIDVTWGTGYTDHTGKFQRKLNEHFFLTDPEVMIWTHFPFSEMENNYSRWQLLDKPLKLEEFNALPKVTPFFFEYNLRIRSGPQNPVIVRVQTELKLAAHRPMRYKFKLYSADDRENASLNGHVFCQLKEDRLLGSFAISPPVEGTYYFKIYARPEWQMYDDTTLKNVAIFLLECVKAKKHINPYPVNDVPWGPTQSFFDYKLKLINQAGPVIVTWGGKRKLVIEAPGEMLISQQVFDATGKELETRGILQREEAVVTRISFTITPPRIGFYKLLIFGMPKPKAKGKWRLPLIASFLIDCKLSKNPVDDDPYANGKKEVKKKRMRIPTVR